MITGSLGRWGAPLSDSARRGEARQAAAAGVGRTVSRSLLGLLQCMPAAQPAAHWGWLYPNRARTEASSAQVGSRGRVKLLRRLIPLSAMSA